MFMWLYIDDIRAAVGAFWKYKELLRKKVFCNPPPPPSPAHFEPPVSPHPILHTHFQNVDNIFMWMIDEVLVWMIDDIFMSLSGN